METDLWDASGLSLFLTLPKKVKLNEVEQLENPSDARTGSSCRWNNARLLLVMFIMGVYRRGSVKPVPLTVAYWFRVRGFESPHSH